MIVGRRQARQDSAGNRMRRRSDRQQVQDHQLAVVIPARRQEARLRLPSVRQQRRIAGEHPAEIDAPVDRVGEAAESRRRAAKHCRTVRTPARSSAESIDDSSLVHSRAPVRMLTKWKNQPRSCGIRAAKKRSVVRARSTAAGRGTHPRSAAMHRPLRPKPTDAMLPTSRALLSTGEPVRSGAIAHDAGLRIGLLPEEHERALRQILEQRIVCRREGRTAALGAGRSARPTGGSRRRSPQGDGSDARDYDDERTACVARRPAHTWWLLASRRLRETSELLDSECPTEGESIASLCSEPVPHPELQPTARIDQAARPAVVRVGRRQRRDESLVAGEVVEAEDVEALEDHRHDLVSARRSGRPSPAAGPRCDRPRRRE